MERDEWLRAAWRVMGAEEIDAPRLVFVDEVGTNISLSPLYAWPWAPKGERAYCSAPRNCGPNTTLLSSMSVEGMGLPLAMEGATNREVFETYVEQILAPTLRTQVAFSKIKGMVCQAGARMREALVEVLGEALSAVGFQEARGYFEHAGYCPQAQLL